MTAAPAPRPRASSGGEAAAVILELLAGYYGGDTCGAGLLVHRLGGWHTMRCQRGYCVVEGDSLRGGQPCSARCRQIHEAVARAAAWLRAHEVSEPVAVAAPRQPRLFDAAAGGGVR